MRTLFTVDLVGSRLSELIMDIAMSGTSVDQRENIEWCFIMTQRKIWYIMHIMESKAHYSALKLDGFIL